jgi:ABC-type uncharacterized transport system substrate-binding protein
MKRRQFVLTTATFALAGCGVLPTVGKLARPGVARVGVLNPSPADAAVPNAQIAGLKQGLAELGYVDGLTIIFEQRDADSNLARLPELAKALVQLPVDVLVTVSGTLATSAAHQATTVVPIVFVAVTDPVGRALWLAWIIRAATSPVSPTSLQQSGESWLSFLLSSCRGCPALPSLPILIRQIRN